MIKLHLINKNYDNDCNSPYEITVPVDNLYRVYRITCDVDLIQEFKSLDEAMKWYVDDMEDGFPFVIYDGKIITSASFFVN